MTDPTFRARAIAAYDAFTHTHLDRRRLMADLAALTGSAAAAAALLPLLAANPAAAAIVPAEDARLRTNLVVEPLSTGRPLNVYHASPAGQRRDTLTAVMVIHENRGLNDHIRDVARRVALAGYLAIAPDFLTVSGGTPANEDAARAAIGALNREQTVADAAAFARHARAEHKRLAAIGFCWGGGMVNSLAAAARADLDAAIPYYGPAPDLAQVPRIKAALLAHLAGDDERVNAGYPAYEAALTKAKVRHTIHRYPGAAHAFNNDTAAERYNKAAADLAWERTLAFLAQHLKGA